MPHFMEVLEKSYNDIGINVKFEKLPLDRGLKMISEGMVDADVIRTDIRLKDVENVITVELLSRGDIVLLCRQEVPCNKEILNDPEAIIGAQIITQDYLRKHFGKFVNAIFINVSEHKKVEELLLKDHLKYTIISTVADVVPEQFANYKHHRLFSIYGYHSVHKKHKALVPELAAAIRKHQQDTILATK